MKGDKFFAAVVGDPVAHSLSPALFARFCAATGRSLVYRKLRVEAGALGAALKRTENEPWIGWNVTLPHKIAVRDFCTELDASAREAGAVNVLRFNGAARTGYNTDAEGFLAPLRERGFSLKGRRVLVLGAGGAARAVCAALRSRGAGEIIVLNRTVERARLLAESCGGRWGGLEAAARETGAADLVVNATSLGLTRGESPVDAGARFKEGALAYDLSYRSASSAFLRAAARGGASLLGGMPMLAAQAAATWRIWFEERLDAALVADAAKELEETL